MTDDQAGSFNQAENPGDAVNEALEQQGINPETIEDRDEVNATIAEEFDKEAEDDKA